MAINFNQNSAFNLKPINKESVRGEVMGLLVNGEEIAYAFQTVRDQLIFTNKRIIAVDVQGITGKRKSFTTMPYSRIQYFTIQTPGFMEAFPDSELFLMFSSGFTATFEGKSGCRNTGTADITVYFVIIKSSQRTRKIWQTG